jgi:YVTN family beta-propeller protein
VGAAPDEAAPTFFIRPWGSLRYNKNGDGVSVRKREGFVNSRLFFLGEFIMKEFISYRIFGLLSGLIFVLVFFPASSFGQGKESGKPAAAQLQKSNVAVRDEVVQKDLKVEFSVIAEGSEEIREGDYATVSFKVTDATTGAPISGINPSSWIDLQGGLAAGKGGGATGCKEKISVYLRGIMGMRPMLDLNSYFILVLNKDASISVIDPLVGITGKTSLYAMILLSRPGADWAKSQDQKRIYVTMPRANQVAVVDTDAFKVTANIDAGDNPVRAAMQPDERYLWVGNNAREATKSGVTIIDTRVQKVAAQIATGKGHHEIAFSADSRFAYVSNRDDGTVSVIDIQKLQKVKDLKTGPLPISLAFSPLSQALYVADAKEGGIAVVGGQGQEVIARIKAKPGLGPQRVTPDGRWLLTINNSEDGVHVVDTSTNQLVRTIPVGSQPYQLTMTREFVYVRSMGTERVTMISLPDIQKGKEDPLTGGFAAGSKPPKAAGELSIASAIVPTAEEHCVLVVNPNDGNLDYYMEGMNTPMGTFRNYGHIPAAVEVADRSLKEVEPGVYAARVRIPAAGAYDVSFFLSSPSIAHCFQMTAKADPSIQQQLARLEVEYLIKDRRVKVGEILPLQFRLLDPKSGGPINGLKDLRVMYYLAPGRLRQEVPVREVEEGVYEASLSIPESGAYYVYVSSPSMKVNYPDLNYLTLQGVTDRNRGRSR